MRFADSPWGNSSRIFHFEFSTAQMFFYLEFMDTICKDSGGRSFQLITGGTRIVVVDDSNVRTRTVIQVVMLGCSFFAWIENP